MPLRISPTSPPICCSHVAPHKSVNFVRPNICAKYVGGHRFELVPELLVAQVIELPRRTDFGTINEQPHSFAEQFKGTVGSLRITLSEFNLHRSASPTRNDLAADSPSSHRNLGILNQASQY